MSETTVDPKPVPAATAEAEAVATLHELNAHYIRAFVESDTAWYREHLSDDFACTLADGRRIGKDEFLQRNAQGPGATDVTYDQIDVQPLGDTALVHGVTHDARDGLPTSTRYTDIWHLRDGRWQAVSAQLTTVANPRQAPTDALLLTKRRGPRCRFPSALGGSS
jgi:ketosteroid isomerase-like protein